MEHLDSKHEAVGLPGLGNEAVAAAGRVTPARIGELEAWQVAGQEVGLAVGRITPARIGELADGQVFVFGSNEYGHHGVGAARVALRKFGAVMGQGRGLQGRSYAIPTMSGSLAAIEREVEEFIQFAASHPDLTFLVTRIGCGIAGYTDDQIAPLFARARDIPNIHLPAEFWQVLSEEGR